MLPRTRRDFVPHGNRLALRKRTHGIGYDAILRPVAAADYVARTRARHPYRRSRRAEEGAAIRGNHDLARALRRTVGIVAAEGICFPERAALLIILIDLIGGDAHHRDLMANPPRRLQHVDRAHHIRFEGLRRLLIREPHERLRREMENEIGLHAAHRAHEQIEIAHIADRMGCDSLRELQLVEEARPRGRFKGETMHLRAEREQPLAQPRALEARMPRNENPLVFIEAFHAVFSFQHRDAESQSLIASSVSLCLCVKTNHFQHRVQGAFPLFHSSFSNWYSRLVSMHCQKPSWR